MLISLSWLQSFLVTPDGEPCGALDPTVVGDALTSLGLEVEGIEHFGAGLESIVVGEVQGIRPHPDSKKLRLVTLSHGAETLEVVCGAPNVPEPGGKVAFAPVGTKLPGGLEIAPREVRGVVSRGMICSEEELEIGPDSSGIIILPQDWAPGSKLIDCVDGIVDTVIELSVTPNRPDALGHVGVARDLAVKLGLELRIPEPELESGPEQTDLVALNEPDRCARYFGYALENVRVGPSPIWLRVRLHRVGLRPINNVVDITNFVLMEFGQPQHAFDRDELAEGRIVVRRASPGEPFRTLDERDLELTDQDLVIADAEKPQALAGVMGGERSGVGEGTSRVLLEAAWFSPPDTRRTARRHGINSDSSFRFERGVDHGPVLEQAALRSRSLLRDLAGAKPVGFCRAEGNRPPAAAIELRLARAKLLLGMDIPAGASKAILEGLGVSVDDSDPERWACTAPTHRPDLTREVDLIEELMRHHGLDHLPAVPSLPAEPEATPQPSPGARRRESVTRALAFRGFHEIVAYAFTGRDKLEPFAGETPLERVVSVANPMRQQLGSMRTHLMPGLLDALGVNLARHGRDVALFEVGRTYAWPDGTVATEGPTATVDQRLPVEKERAAALACTGSGQDGRASIDAVAAALLQSLARLGLRGTLRPAGAVGCLHPGVQARIVVGGKPVGYVGEVHPDILRTYDLADHRPAYGELWLDDLADPGVTQMQPIPRFPSTARDVSLEIPVELAAAIVVDAFATSGDTDADDNAPHLERGDTGGAAVEVLEDYRGDNVPAGRRSLLLRLHYRATDRSVTDDEVQTVHEGILGRALSTLQSHADVRVR